MLTKERTAELVKKFGKDEKDTGCTAVQVAILTDRIAALTAHLKSHGNDNHCRRGLFILVGQRKKFLNYMIKNDPEGYEKLVKELKLR